MATPPPKRLPDHGGPVDAEEVEEVPHDGGKVAQRVVAKRFFRRPMARKSGASTV